MTLAGEKSTSFQRASQDVDTSDKDGASGVMIPGRVTFSVNGTTKLPDAGYSRFYGGSKTGEPMNLQLAKGTVTRYAGPVSVGNFKSDYDRDGVVTYSFDLSATAPASIDALDAVA